MTGTKRRSNYLNVGCGAKFHVDWTNVDMTSVSPHVQAHNLLKGFPYADASFDVVYHSQVLEHFPKDRARSFMLECFRVLRPGGTIRVVVPDLEDVVREYLRLLDKNASQPSAQSVADYEWIVVELLDQLSRNSSGGQMKAYLANPGIINEEYVVKRIGRIGRDIVAATRQRADGGQSAWQQRWEKAKQVSWRRLFGFGTNWLVGAIGGEAVRVGRFRTGGEPHLWMYDRFSLGQLLQGIGFTDVAVVDAHRSSIPDWSSYALDVREGAVVDPNSLFVEAVKPLARPAR